MSQLQIPYLLYLGPLLELGPMTPNAKATAHQRKPVGRCGVALPVFPKKLKKLISARALNTANTYFKLQLIVILLPSIAG